MRDHAVHPQADDPCGERGKAKIHTLPDNVLLEIFDFYRDDPINHTHFTWKWKALTQVCRRWRYVIFASPRRLDLRLVCTTTTPTKILLDIWPPFPIILASTDGPDITKLDEKNVENLIAAVKRRDRTSEIYISATSTPALKKLFAVMQEPLPVLTHIDVTSLAEDESAPVLLETFLGGSTPRLRSLSLHGIPFPSFPKFIFSATHIDVLKLSDIPDLGYFSPTEMVTCLAALPSLDALFIGFRSPLSNPVQIGPPPFSHAVLPSLTTLYFCGLSEYFEDLVAQIDTPRLNELSVGFFMEPIFDIPQLHNFINRTESLKSWNQAEIEFSYPAIRINLWSPTWFQLTIKCERPYSQLSSMTQIFSQHLPLLSHIEHLEIRDIGWEGMEWKDDPDMDSSLWLELFRLFTAVRSLYVFKTLLPSVASALQELTGGRTMEVLPALHNLSLDGLQPYGPMQEAINSFVAARQLSGHPVAIQRWD